MRGVFLNQPKAQCSIYESGWMFAACLNGSNRYQLDYAEVSTLAEIPAGYDFYVFNWHFVTMAWLPLPWIANLPGRKYTVALEVLPGDPFARVPAGVFDGYLVPDPTMPATPTVHPFPRPLPVVSGLPEYRDGPAPIIGTFGFAAGGKTFGRLVQAVNAEFDEAVIRLHLPLSTFADPRGANALAAVEECRATAKPGVRIESTHHYMSKAQLVAWCSQNTLNAFFYERDIPGLSATTDEAVAAGRPILVSDCKTFRHMHPYLGYYPQVSLRQAIAESGPVVKRIQQDWAPAKFRETFERVLAADFR